MLALLTVSSVTNGHAGLRQTVTDRLEPPWVEPYDNSTYQRLYAALDAAPAGSIDVSISLTASSRSEVGSDYNSVHVTITLTAPPVNPLIRLLRSGLDADRIGDEVADIVGSPMVDTWYVGYDRPTVNLDSVAADAKAVVTIVGRGDVRGDQQHVTLRSPNSCAAIGERVVRADSPDLRVTGVGIADNDQPEDCTSGTWTAQTERSATYSGTGEATIDFDSEAASSAVFAERPLIRLAAGDGSAVGYSALALIPLALAWWRLRWTSHGGPGARTATVFGGLLALHVIIGVGNTPFDVSLWASRWLTKHDAVSDAGFGYPNLLMPATIIAALAFVWRRAAVRAVTHTADTRPAGADVALVVAALVLSGCVFWWALMEDYYSSPADSAEPTGGSAASWGTADLLVVLVAAGIVGMVAAAALARAVRAPAGTTAAAGVVVAALLLAIAPLAQIDGSLGDLVGAAVPLAAAVLLWLALYRLIGYVLDGYAFDRWSMVIARLRPWQGLRYLAAVLLSVPFVVYGSADSPPVSWYEFQSLASSVDNCLRLIFVVLLVLLVRHLGSGGTQPYARGTWVQLRSVAVLVAVLGLLTPTVAVGGVPIAFLVGWLLIEIWLLPRARGASGHPLAGPVQAAATNAALVDLLRRVLTGRARLTLQRDLLKKVADEEEPAQEATITRAVTLALHRQARSEPLSTYGGRTPWRRARELAVAGLVVGLPWTLLDVTAVLNTITSGGPFRLIDAAAAALVLFRFGLAGLVLGAAYPLVRGSTGLAKGLALCITLTASGLCITLLPDPHADGAWLAAAVQAAQWLSYGIVLGLLADLQMLRQAGLGWRHLRELHHLTAVTASISSVLIAALTAGTTAVGTGAANLFVERVLTPPPAPTATDNR